MIEQVASFLKDYGWLSGTFNSPASGDQFVFTRFDYEPLIIHAPILIKEVDNWLFISTHKLFKFTKKDTGIMLKFLEYNNEELSVKWFTRELTEETYINIGGEICTEEFSQFKFNLTMDLLCTSIEDVANMLTKQGDLTAENLTPVTDDIVKNSFEYY